MYTTKYLHMFICKVVDSFLGIKIESLPNHALASRTQSKLTTQQLLAIQFLVKWTRPYISAQQLSIGRIAILS